MTAFEPLPEQRPVTTGWRATARQLWHDTMGRIGLRDGRGGRASSPSSGR